MSAVSAVLVLATLATATAGLYFDRNSSLMRRSTQEPVVSSAEVAGYEALASMAAPNERVMNDRGDGSVWMYALTGVHSVAAHYEAPLVGPDAALLAARFNQYDTDPTVRAAARRLNVHWVAIGESFIVDSPRREAGLVDLDRVAALRQVWSNGTFRIYRLQTTPAS